MPDERFRGMFANRASTDPSHPKRSLRGRRYGIPLDRVWEATVRLVREDRGRWSVTEVDEREGTIRAEARTRLFGFVDDVRIRVGRDADGQTRVDLASRSRVGKWDLGTNARRIRHFLRDLDRALEAGPSDILEPTPRESARAPEGPGS